MPLAPTKKLGAVSTYSGNELGTLIQGFEVECTHTRCSSNPTLSFFNIDGDGILNFYASDKSNNGSNITTIVNDKSEEEATASRIQAKNDLKSYPGNLWNSTTDEKLPNKFAPANKTKLTSVVGETIPWLHNSEEVEEGGVRI
ncbi:hypothetical protein DL96DRAFT_1687490 [Flagelloscypha sp. PMI_526]|nr:hypothetical protein DL96DRAFT_1687490 [Flagelloscypha sp. PMI_526]